MKLGLVGRQERNGRLLHQGEICAVMIGEVSTCVRVSILLINWTKMHWRSVLIDEVGDFINKCQR